MRYNLVISERAEMHNDVIDGLRLFEDIACADSIGHTFYAISDVSYLLQTDGHAVLCGKDYRISGGEII